MIIDPYFFILNLMQIESFDGQKEGEKIISVWRGHAWVLSRAGFIFSAIVLIGSIPSAFFRPSWGAGFLFLFIAVGILYLLLQVYLYLSTLYILTSERILAINQSRFLTRSINELPLHNIQNVSHNKKGVFEMLMDFGTVEVQTAGSTTAISINKVAHPYQVQQKIISKM